MEIQRNVRYRVNISTSVKGVKTFDCTVEMENATMEGVLAQSDRLVKQLTKRYPAPKEE